MSNPISTENLAQRAKAGDHQAIQDLIAHFSPRLEGFVHSHMGQGVQLQLDAEDVLQETFTRAFQSIRTLKWQGEKAFFSWLASIAENIILNASKKVDRMPLQLKQDVSDAAGSPSRDLRRNERFDRFQRALDGVSPDHRKVIFLVRIERLRIEEIANRMNRSPNAVKKLLARALEELKKGFGDTESLHLPPRQINFKGVEDE